MLDISLRRNLHVPFGLREGRLYEPIQVEQGLACNCTCPGCSGALIAKHAPLGKVRPHFAHHSDSACVGGLESAVHLAAKQLINEKRKLYLPELVATVSSRLAGFQHMERRETVHKGSVAHLDQVRVEESLGQIRPDLIVETAGHQVLVEIAFTSFVSSEKLELIKLKSIGAIEVDVSDLAELNFETLSKRLFERSPRSTWIFHPDLAIGEAALELQLAVDVQNEMEVRRLQEEKIRLREEQIRKRVTERKQQQLDKRQLEATRDAEKAAAYKALSNDEKLGKALRQLGSRESVSTLLPLKVRWASTIKASPLVWQAAVVAYLILPALPQNTPTLSSEQVQSWLRHHFMMDDTPSNGVAIAVWDFLNGLKELNVLHSLRNQNFLVAVYDISGALAVADDARDLGMLLWAEEWPSLQQVTAVKKVFLTIYGNHQSWERVSGLLPEVRGHEPPQDTLAYYASLQRGSLNSVDLKRFFLSAGFTRLCK